MDHFSISQVARFSGIKPHTIRMWEQRYNALTPSRSKGNTRYYSSDELRRVLNIVSLSGDNYKISELCEMSNEKLFRLIAKKENKTGKQEANEYFISQLIAAGILYDENYLEKVFSNCLLRLGMRQTYLKVLYPALVRLGLKWATNDLPPSHEHFISNLIRRKLLLPSTRCHLTNQKQRLGCCFCPKMNFTK